MSWQRGSKPGKGDAVWIEDRIKEGKQPNGMVAWRDGDDVGVNFYSNRDGEQFRDSDDFDISIFNGCHRDYFGGIWMIYTYRPRYPPYTVPKVVFDAKTATPWRKA